MFRPGACAAIKPTDAIETMTFATATRARAWHRGGFAVIVVGALRRERFAPMMRE